MPASPSTQRRKSRATAHSAPPRMAPWLLPSKYSSCVSSTGTARAWTHVGGPPMAIAAEPTRMAPEMASASGGCPLRLESAPSRVDSPLILREKRQAVGGGYVTTRRVVVIEGEDAAPEAVRPTVALVDRLGLDLEWVRPPIDDHEATRQAIDHSGSTLFGATSGRSAAALFYLRWGRQTYANVRPARWLPGYRSPLAH